MTRVNPNLSSAPPIMTRDNAPYNQRAAIFKPYGINTGADLLELDSRILETGSIWTGRETSFSGADIKIYLMIYGDKRQKLKAALEAQIDKGLDESEQIAKTAANYPGLYAVGSVKDQVYEKERKITESINTARNELGKLETGQPAFLELAEAQTLSVSSHRDKFPVRALGSVGPRGWSRGMRTIAGTMIFTVFNKHPLGKILYGDFYSFEGHTSGTRDEGYELPDQLPPMDLMLLGANEYGYMCRMILYGVEFVSEGMTFSIEDLITESQLQYVARDWDPLRDVRTEQDLKRSGPQLWSISGSDLINDANYQRYRKRSNPFL